MSVVGETVVCLEYETGTTIGQHTTVFLADFSIENLSVIPLPRSRFLVTLLYLGPVKMRYRFGIIDFQFQIAVVLQ